MLKTHKQEKVKYAEELKDLYFEDQSLRRVISVMRRKCENDSIFRDHEIDRVIFNAIINKQDSLRSLRFLELIERHGYPDETINTENIAYYTIFLHSPNSLHDRINSVLRSSSISEEEYQAVKWHLNNRKGIPIFIDGMKYYSDAEIFDYFKK